MQALDSDSTIILPQQIKNEDNDVCLIPAPRPVPRPVPIVVAGKPVLSANERKLKEEIAKLKEEIAKLKEKNDDLERQADLATRAKNLAIHAEMKAEKDLTAQEGLTQFWRAKYSKLILDRIEQEPQNAIELRADLNSTDEVRDFDQL